MSPQIGYEVEVDVRPLLDSVKADFNKDGDVVQNKTGGKVKDEVGVAKARCLAGIESTKVTYESKTQDASHPWHLHVIRWQKPAFKVVERDAKLIMQGICEFSITKP